MPYGTVNADVIGTSVAGSNIGAGNASIMKNRIINGAMVIDQRNACASVTQTNAVLYGVDRWYTYGTVASKFTAQQNAGSVTPPVGFTNYWGITSSSAYSVGTSEQFIISQAIEGYNTADLGFGTANAKTITISFWVRSSLTGTFAGGLGNNANDRSYSFNYTISAANTWEQKTITIAGDTTGTWNTTSAQGIVVNFSMGTGSTYQSTANTWVAGNFKNVSGAVNIVGTSGATFYITGVQLEVGSSATGFEYVNYQTSLANCQRYYRDSTIGIGGGVANSTTVVLRGTHPTTMRTTPTVGGASMTIYLLTVAGSFSQSSFNANASVTSAADFTLECANFSGMTAYYPVGMVSGKLTFSAEL